VVRGAECGREDCADPAGADNPDTGHDSSPFVPVLQRGTGRCADAYVDEGTRGVTAG
jgi:hypothetical protein